MKDPGAEMSQKQRECWEHERWLGEYTDRLRNTLQAQEQESKEPLTWGCCWQCDAAATLHLIIGSVRVQLCENCAEQKRQELTTALFGIAGNRKHDPESEDRTEPAEG
jgi:hypothetical protein